MFEALCLNERTRRCLDTLTDIPDSSILLSGEKGLGKASVAKILAAAYLHVPVERLCYHPDFRMITATDDGAIKLEQIQELTDIGAICSSEGGKRVFLIDGADRMTDAAQNAILKFIEDDGDTSVVIFVNHAEVIPTIRSRCTEVQFLKPQNFRDFLKDEVEELAYLLADGIPGRYFSFLAEPEFLADVKAHLVSWCSGDAVETLRSFHLLKEKDENTMLEKWGADHTSCFFIAIRNILTDLVTGGFQKIPHDTEVITYSRLAERYSIEELVIRLQMLEKHLSMLKVKGHYTANDYLSFVIGLAV